METSNEVRWSSDRRRVLVVDDEAERAIACEATLLSLGHEVLRVRAPEDAVRLARESYFDAAIVGARSTAKAEALTAELVGRGGDDRPAVFLVGSEPIEREEALRAYAFGATDVLSPPIDHQLLRAKVAAALALGHSHPERSRRIAAVRTAGGDAERGHLALIAEAATAISRSDDEAGLGAALARLLVRRAACWCSIDLFEGETLRRVARAVGDEDVSVAPHERPVASAPDAVLAAITSMHSHVVDADASSLAAIEDDVGERVRLSALRPRSIAVVPAVARGRLTAVLIVASRQAAVEDDIEVLEHVAARFAHVLDAVRSERALRRCERVRDELLSMAAHELRSPVTSLGLLLHQTRRALLDDARVCATLQRATTVVSRVHRLIDDLLDVALASAGKLALRPELVDVTAIVSEVVERERDDAAHHGSSFELELTPTFAWLDPLRIGQIATNLVTNAVKYGSGKSITVKVEPAGSDVLLVVRDHGVGIEPELRARLFQPFERSTARRNVAGAGLGLWITRRIVDTCGGTISVASEPGRGSTFEVRLPATRDVGCEIGRPIASP